MADDLITRIFQKTYGYSDAQMAEIAERAKERDAERREFHNFGTLPRRMRLHINEHSTMNYAQQGITRR